jgi:hypothetical protein
MQRIFRQGHYHLCHRVQKFPKKFYSTDNLKVDTNPKLDTSEIEKRSKKVFYEELNNLGKVVLISSVSATVCSISILHIMNKYGY